MPRELDERTIRISFTIFSNLIEKKAASAFLFALFVLIEKKNLIEKNDLLTRVEAEEVSRDNGWPPF
jgi:hypothetical protein